MIIIYLILLLLGALGVYAIASPETQAKVRKILTSAATEILGIAGPALNQAKDLFAPVAKVYADVFKATGVPIAESLAVDFQAVARALLEAQQGAIKSAGLSTPDNAIDTAAVSFTTAFGAGLSSAAVAALFEAAFPEKLNVLNGVAPMIAKMAGFDEVAAEVLAPLYKSAFGRSLEYHYRSIFKPELPNESDAVEWHGRRLLTDDQMRTIFGFSGLKSEYEEAFVKSAYRSLNPRILVNLLQDQPIDPAVMTDVLQFAGLRDSDIAWMIPALTVATERNVRQQYLAAAVRSTELGTMTPAELDGVMVSMNFSDQAKHWVQLTVATRKLEQLAELYRKSVSEGYRYGTITDAEYVPSLQAIGIGDADAQAHYAIDSIAKQGKAAMAALKAEEVLARKQASAGMQAAIASFQAGAIDEAGLLAAMLALGIDPTIAAYAVTLQTERRAGPLVFVYGMEVSRDRALVVRENVRAIEDQFKKQLISDSEAAIALSNLGIPGNIATPLLAGWAALKTKATTTGELLPR